VGQERGADIWPWGVAFLAKSVDGSLRAELASRVWLQTHLAGTRPRTAPAEDEEEPDAWDLRYNRAGTYLASVNRVQVGQHLHSLPNPAVLREGDGHPFVPPFVAAEVTSLPRGCPVEWWSMGVAHLPKAHGFKPRVSVTQNDYDWGHIGGVTISPPSYTATEQAVSLLTVLVYQEAMLAKDSDCMGRIESDLLAVVSSARTRASVKVVHGTGFVSTASLESWSRMHEHRLFAPLVVIPCYTVYGCSNFGAVSDFEQKSLDNINSMTDVRKSSTAQKTSPQTRSLAMAMTLRIDL
jgi:hypothetical protein